MAIGSKPYGYPQKLHTMGREITHLMGMGTGNYPLFVGDEYGYHSTQPAPYPHGTHNLPRGYGDGHIIATHAGMGTSTDNFFLKHSQLVLELKRKFSSFSLDSHFVNCGQCGSMQYLESFPSS